MDLNLFSHQYAAQSSIKIFRAQDFLVTRPDEFGDNKKTVIENDKRWEFYCRDFNQLADELNCD